MEVCKGDRSAFSPPKDRLVSCLTYKEGNKGSWQGGGQRRTYVSIPPSLHFPSSTTWKEKAGPLWSLDVITAYLP